MSNWGWIWMEMGIQMCLNVHPMKGSAIDTLYLHCSSSPLCMVRSGLGVSHISSSPSSNTHSIANKCGNIAWKDSLSHEGQNISRMLTIQYSLLATAEAISFSCLPDSKGGANALYGTFPSLLGQLMRLVQAQLLVWIALNSCVCFSIEWPCMCVTWVACKILSKWGWY